MVDVYVVAHLKFKWLGMTIPKYVRCEHGNRCTVCVLYVYYMIVTRYINHIISSTHTHKHRLLVTLHTQQKETCALLELFLCTWTNLPFVYTFSLLISLDLALSPYASFNQLWNYFECVNQIICDWSDRDYHFEHAVNNGRLCFFCLLLFRCHCQCDSVTWNGKRSPSKVQWNGSQKNSTNNWPRVEWLIYFGF